MKNRRVLAEGPLTRLEICPCGSCYLTVGPLTVSIHTGVVEELGDTIARALAALRSEPAPRPEPAAGGRLAAEAAPEPADDTEECAGRGGPLRTN